ncbi:polymer-forming cytoskeletal protein [Brucepastera parasyntrophica]|uniref:bactofilin family protein n=1 Tax=Brucepastera parasyntrophica TaxID=2880008 RepID=UPI00210A5126|nr:polymer-forming cytoskeletal protein [Brucepastera parasyntrophica]ULQ58695.1 polymer-forming cytoskeletal protein [Brucepastera parasyntrophica]
MAFASSDPVSINTLIGPDSFVKGELKISGFVRIDGDIDGNLETTGRIIIGENARIRGNISSNVVTIGGIVQGDVIAPEGVTILSTGLVLGTILTKHLQIEDSVIINGYCFAVNDETKFDAALATYKNRQALADSALSIPSNGIYGDHT